VLVRILEEHHPERIRQFFEAYGAPEAAAMCIAITSARPGTHPVVSMHDGLQRACMMDCGRLNGKSKALLSCCLISVILCV